jgi:hypothetical protein
LQESRVESPAFLRFGILDFGGSCGEVVPS